MALTTPTKNALRHSIAGGSGSASEVITALDAITDELSGDISATSLTVTGKVTSVGLVVTSSTDAAITAARVLTSADSGGCFSVAKTSAYGITLPTPAQGISFKFLILDTGSYAVTFSDGSAHLYGQINQAGTVPIAMTGTMLTAASGGSIGDWLEFRGIDATHYLVTGSAIAASKFTIAG
jgi:hypothetical protein